MTRPRAADDFDAIRARMEELRRERAQVLAESQQRQLTGPWPYWGGGRLAPADKPQLQPAILRALTRASTD